MNLLVDSYRNEVSTLQEQNSNAIIKIEYAEEESEQLLGENSDLSSDLEALKEIKDLLET